MEQTTQTAAFNMLLLLTSLVIAISHGMPYSDGSNSVCPVCEPQFCPKSDEDCPRGVVSDPCGCCNFGLCQLAQGDRCLDATSVREISKTDFGVYGTCGKAMSCLKRTDIDPEAPAESTCSCLDSTVVCGTDNHTYDSTCSLHSAAGQPRMTHVGPCSSAPVIDTTSEDFEGPVGASLALDCEVSGFPVPSLHWEFQPTGGAPKPLPGDDSEVVVQTRGGPEHYMVSSWVQIMSARADDSGNYICVATNAHGIAKRATAVRIIKST